MDIRRDTGSLDGGSAYASNARATSIEKELSKRITPPPPLKIGTMSSQAARKILVPTHIAHNGSNGQRIYATPVEYFGVLHKFHYAPSIHISSEDIY